MILLHIQVTLFVPELQSKSKGVTYVQVNLFSLTKCQKYVTYAPFQSTYWYP